MPATMIEQGRGNLRKMVVEPAEPAQYHLPLVQGGETGLHPLNGFVGQHIRLEFLGEIHCIHCGRKTKKSYNQGYCFPCCRDLARCDQCIVKPEQCHHHLGTCREPEWGDTHCMIPHYVYLANSTGIKVGITRHSQIPTRWYDQGAVQALPVCRVDTRLQSGLLEVVLANHIADKTNWRALLKGDVPAVDLAQQRDRLYAEVGGELAALQSKFGVQALQWLPDAELMNLSYPVQSYPGKVVSLKLDKHPLLEGELLGIKGQYLFFPQGAINMRSHAGYQVALHTA